MTGSERCTRPKIIPESCFRGFWDDNWPISKYQETPAANQPLPTPCLCSKLINAAVNLGSGLLFSSTVLDVTRALARASNKPLYAFALLWMSYSLSFGDSDTGQNIMSEGNKNVQVNSVLMSSSNILWILPICPIGIFSLMNKRGSWLISQMRKKMFPLDITIFNYIDYSRGSR